jgi:hypothetical protein
MSRFSSATPHGPGSEESGKDLEPRRFDRRLHVAVYGHHPIAIGWLDQDRWLQLRISGFLLRLDNSRRKPRIR